MRFLCDASSGGDISSTDRPTHSSGEDDSLWRENEHPIAGRVQQPLDRFLAFPQGGLREHPLRDVREDAPIAQRRSVLVVVNLPLGEAVANLAAAGEEAIAELEDPLAGQGLLGLQLYRLPVLWVNVGQLKFLGGFDLARLVAVHAEELVRPEALAGSDVAFKGTDVGRGLGFVEQGLAHGQAPCRLLAAPHLLFEPRHRLLQLQGALLDMALQLVAGAQQDAQQPPPLGHVEEHAVRHDR